MFFILLEKCMLFEKLALRSLGKTLSRWTVGGRMILLNTHGWREPQAALSKKSLESAHVKTGTGKIRSSGILPVLWACIYRAGTTFCDFCYVWRGKPKESNVNRWSFAPVQISNLEYRENSSMGSSALVGDAPKAWEELAYVDRSPCPWSLNLSE